MAAHGAFLPLCDPPGGGLDLRALLPTSSVEVAAGERWSLGRDRVAMVVQGALLAVEAGPQDDAASMEVVGPGDLLGEAAFLSDGRRCPVELRALVRARAVTADSGALWTLAGDRSAVARLLIRQLARRGERLRRRVAVLGSLGVRARLLETLRDLAATHGHGHGGEAIVALPLTQELLAGLVGCSRESVNRALRALMREGAVRRAGGAYVVRVDAPPPWTSAKTGSPSGPPGLSVVTMPSRSSLSR
jgi:CRP-like cAMP-binding protein